MLNKFKLFIVYLIFYLFVFYLFSQNINAQVILYEKTNFQGVSITLNVGSHRLTTLNNKASSIKVPKGFTAIVYDKEKPEGVHCEFKTDCSNLIDMCSKGDAPYSFSDKISYVVVGRSNLSPPPPPVRGPGRSEHFVIKPVDGYPIKEGYIIWDTGNDGFIWNMDHWEAKPRFRNLFITNKRFVPYAPSYYLNCLNGTGDDWRKDSIYMEFYKFKPLYIDLYEKLPGEFNKIVSDIEDAYKRTSTTRTLLIDNKEIQILITNNSNKIAYHVLPTIAQYIPFVKNNKECLGKIVASEDWGTSNYALDLDLKLIVTSDAFEAARIYLRNISWRSKVDSLFSSFIFINNQILKLEGTTVTGELIPLSSNTLRATIELHDNKTLIDIYKKEKKSIFSLRYMVDSKEQRIILPLAFKESLLDTLMQSNYSLDNFETVIETDQFMQTITLTSGLDPNLTLPDGNMVPLSCLEIYLNISCGDSNETKGPFRLGSFQTTQAANIPVRYLKKEAKCILSISGSAIYDQGNVRYDIKPFDVVSDTPSITFTENLFK